MSAVRESLRRVTLGDWVLEVLTPGVILGWGVWIANWFGIWLGSCGLLYFVLRVVVYPARNRGHSEYGRLLPGVGALCVCGVFAGFSWTLVVVDGASDAVVLGILMSLFALPFGFAAVVFLSTTVAGRFGLAPQEPVVSITAEEWPDPPPYGGPLL